MQSTSQKGIFTCKTSNGYTVTLDINFYKVIVSHPTNKRQNYDLEGDSPISHLALIINGLEKIKP